ncbi:ABC transporter substrate-binding protein [Halorussus gelatinilyticus]|uniref:ABC transporter substrate-binding protein n=1 Tax=Halorussus gelatinilyticus TaxID=2937524 RepID=A0A8U0IEI3_9EURY|nr:ABC transporter substrate-binding protein [Halorussus gelatinilyticus]UPV99090.1 ABC transporter substrate-binding protein [Halorussus gelatinilyticus]
MGEDNPEFDSGRRKFLQASGAGAVALSFPGAADAADGATERSSTVVESTDATAQNVQDGGIFTMGMGQQPKGLNPLSTSSAYSWAILDMVYDAGTVVDPVEFKVRPNVYTDWTVEVPEGKANPQPDVYFNVRDGLTWTDGEKLTVEDVVFTYDYMKEQEPGRYASTIQPIKSVQKASKGDWDVHMKLKKPIGTYASNQLALPILPKHIWSDVNSYRDYAPTENGGPVGTGPGTVTKYAEATAIEVEFRDDYPLGELKWRDEVEKMRSGGPFLDAVRFKIFGSDSALQQAFLRGNIDSIYSTINVSKISKVKNNQGQKLVPGYDTGYNYFAYNMRRQPLDDATFRQATSMVFDDYYWTERLQEGYEYMGDFVMPPGFSAVRPEKASKNAKLLESPATNAFEFRQKEPGVPDYDGIKSFLTEGKVIDGDKGNYVGKQYPGTLTGVTGGQSKAKHDYSYGPVQSQVLRQKQGVEEEIRVNGKTIPEINGGPLQVFIYPAKDTPKLSKMAARWVDMMQKLGIPAVTKVMTFNTMLGRVYSQEDFDIYPMAWSDLSPFATGTLYNIFHSENADDHSKKEGYDQKNTTTQLNNAMGYGLVDAGADDLISRARSTMESQKRNQLARKAIERIYLDFPYMVIGYDKLMWPVNGAEFGGFVPEIPGPGAANLSVQLMQIHQSGGGNSTSGGGGNSTGGS